MLVSVSTSAPVPARRAVEALTDPEFTRTWLAAVGVLSERIDVDGDADDTIRTTWRAVLATDVMPDSVRTALPATPELRRASVWNGPLPGGGRRGTAVLDIVGAPARMISTMSITPQGEAACEYVFSGDLRVRLPLVGASVEQALAPVVRSLLQAECDALAGLAS